MPSYTFSLNGAPQTVDAPEDMPLLWVLRDILGLTGTKYGCGIGQCRACTVHLDDSPIFSCQVPISSVGAASVVTIEGLEPELKERLVAAWAEEDVPQCGYCQPGQIMSAAGLLRRLPAPSAGDIDQAMNPNLCRCGTYNRIRRAIERAASGG